MTANDSINTPPFQNLTMEAPPSDTSERTVSEDILEEASREGNDGTEQPPAKSQFVSVFWPQRHQVDRLLPQRLSETIYNMSNYQKNLILWCIVAMALVWLLKRRKNDEEHRQSAAATTTARWPLRPDSMDLTKQSSRWDLLSPVSMGSVPMFDEMIERRDPIAASAAETIRRFSWAALGPNVSSIAYTTFRPPTKWTEASKQLLPSQTRPRPHCQLEMNLKEGRLIVDDTITKATYSLMDINIHVHTPVEGGVLDINIENSSAATTASPLTAPALSTTPLATTGTEGETQSIEHTFSIAFDAAQFQFDLLAYQVVGKAVMNLYNAFELIHKGSMAHNGPESVLHSSTGETSTTAGAAAWDDVMRCLGCGDDRDPFFVSIRRTLERCTFARDGTMLVPALEESYQHKRALLGPVDFFRIFVPPLPPSTLPEDEAHPYRMEALLRIRKQVAKAAVWVRSYVRARVVANQGWKPEWPTPVKRRLAFDDNLENMRHDKSAKNEYYEGTISRDIVCSVKYGDKVHRSPYQAYMLVGCHQVEMAGPIRHDMDPVEAIPSLRTLVCRNPDLHFVCTAFFVQERKMANVAVYVRSLPKGVDSAFDKNLDSFVKGDSDYRTEKLQITFQLGPGSRFSGLLWSGLKFLNFCLFNFAQSTEDEEYGVVNETTEHNRISFPYTKMKHYLDMNHFGGGASSPAIEMPMNYVASSARIRSTPLGSFLFRMFLGRLHAQDGMRSSIVDFSYMLKGLTEDECPERVLFTFRAVHMDPYKSSLPATLTLDEEDEDELDTHLLSPRSIESARNEFSTDNLDVSRTDQTDRSDPFVSISEDTFRDGVNALVEVLDDVSIPFRKQGLSRRNLDMAGEIPEDQIPIALPECVDRNDLVHMRILDYLSRDDLRRYFQAEECNLRKAARRIVESTAWRGMTFPIDLNSCRVELHSGQFFHQGFDRRGHPVFYFRNTCVGSWRRDEDAVVAAVLHRLEMTVKRLESEQRGKPVRITFVVLMGKPLFRKKKRRPNDDDGDDASVPNTGSSVTTDDESTRASQQTNNKDSSSWNAFGNGVNPRVMHPEDYTVHSTPSLLRKLVRLMMAHYPERLYKVVIAPGKRRGYGYFGTAVGAQLAIHNNITSARTRSKCFILHRLGELKEFIDPEELISIAGGRAPIQSTAFECR